MRESTDWLAKFVAICFVEFVLLSVVLVVCVLMQTIAGFHQYDLVQYCQELYLVVLPQVIGFTLLAIFVQTVGVEQVCWARNCHWRVLATDDYFPFRY
jgi:ABC-2 type transport system permease protein